MLDTFLARVPESQRSARLSEIYCMVSEKDEPDEATEVETSTICSIETMSVDTMSVESMSDLTSDDIAKRLVEEIIGKAMKVIHNVSLPLLLHKLQLFI